jgi:23S rRNA G2445 N2-methylase RlmL
MRDRHTYFAPCPPGFERVLLDEARGLGLGRPEAQPGGVQFEGGRREAMLANLGLRSASRVLRVLARFPASDADALYAGVSGIDWERFLGPDGRLKVQARTKASALSHEQFVEQRTKDAVADAFRQKHGRRPTVDLADPDLVIHVRLLRDRATVSADTSGESLFKRGWRRYAGGAPLKENLAAAIVLSSGWDRRAPFLDPFCGSGTLLVEAGLIASNAAPGLFREDFSFRRWPGHDEKEWEAMREEARRKVSFPGKLVMLARDSSREAVDGARTNLEAAGLAGRVRVEAGDFAGLETKPGWNATLVTNPPYGERMGEERKLVPVYTRFGEMLKTRCGGYRAAILTGNPALARRLPFPDARRNATRTGPNDCELLLVDVPR